MFDIILQNNGTRQVYLIKKENVSTDGRYLQFEDVDIGDMQDGEYTYIVIRNDREDVTYEYADSLIDSLIHTEDMSIKLRYLSPLTGLLRIGEVEDKNTYKKNNKVIYYED